MEQLNLRNFLVFYFVILISIVGIPLILIESRIEYPGEPIIALVFILLTFSFSSRIRGEINIYYILSVICFVLFLLFLILSIDNLNNSDIKFTQITKVFPNIVRKYK